MARPKKDGLDYFPLDIDFFGDEKIEAIAGEFGAVGEVVVLRLLCAIYRNGYYLELTGLTKMKLCKDAGVDIGTLERIIARTLEWELFDKETYEGQGVLTSAGVQRRYFEAVRKRKGRPSELPHLLVEIEPKVVNAEKTEVNSAKTPINSEFMPQSKVKESKVKERTTTSLKDDAAVADDYDELARQYLHPDNRQYVEAFCMGNYMSEDELRRLVAEVITDWKEKCVHHHSYADAVDHLKRTVLIKRRCQNNQPNQQPLNETTDGLQIYAEQLRRQRAAGPVSPL